MLCIGLTCSLLMSIPSSILFRNSSEFVKDGGIGSSVLTHEAGGDLC